jgi:hypothetical protein
MMSRNTNDQGRMKLSPVDHLVDGILVLVQNDNNDKKKKVFAARNLKDCYQVYHFKQDSKKKKNQSFLSRQVCASLEMRGRPNLTLR